MRDTHDALARTPGQCKLLDGVRFQNNPAMGDIIKESSIDDLDWFLQMMEYQLQETPHWVEDKQNLHEIQAWTRRVRTMASDLLHRKRVEARKGIWLRRVGEKLFYVLLGVALTWIAGRYGLLPGLWR